MLQTEQQQTNGAITARKDRALVYRACSSAYAELLGAREPSGVIGRSDSDLLRASRASLWEATQRLVLHDSVCSVTPLLASGRAGAWMVQSVTAERDGVDIAVVPANQVLRSMLRFAPASVETRVERIVVAALEGALLSEPESPKTQYPSHARNWSAADQRLHAWLSRRAGSLAPPAQFATQRIPESGEAAVWQMPVRWHRRRAVLLLLLYPERSLLRAAVPAIARAVSPPESTLVVDNPPHLSTALLSGSPAASLLLEGQRATHASASAARLLGFEGVTDLRAELVMPANVVLQLRQIAGSDRSVLCRWNRRDGRVLYLSASAARLSLSGRDRLAVYLIDQTSTARRMAALRADRERFHDFAESAADFFFELDAALGFVYLSDRFESVFGIEADDVHGLTIDSFHSRYIPQPSTADWSRHLAALRAQQSQIDFEYSWTRPHGEERILLHSCHAITDANGRFCGFRGVGRDITRDRKLAEQVHFHATHDALTGLINRREFDRLLAEAIENAKASGNQHALCFIDLDYFKRVNDSAGHQAGDTVLQELAVRFVDCLRQSDRVGRLGGDEFGVLIYHCDPRRAERIGTQLRDTARDYRLEWEGQTYQVGASVGVVGVHAESQDIETVMRAADMACYASKAAGRGHISVGLGVHDSTASKPAQAASANERGQPCAAQLLREMILPLRAGAQGDFQRLQLWTDSRAESPGDLAMLPAQQRLHPDAAAERDMEAIAHCLSWVRGNASDLDLLRLLQLRLSGGFLKKSTAIDKLARQLESSGLADTLCLEIPASALVPQSEPALARVLRWGCRLCASQAHIDFRTRHLYAVQLDYRDLSSELASRQSRGQLMSRIKRAQSDGLAVQVTGVAEAGSVLTLRDLGVDSVAGIAVSEPEVITLRTPRSL